MQTHSHSSQIQIKRLGPTEQAELEAFLQPHRASSLFLLSNPRLGGLEDQGQRYQGSYFGAYLEGQLQGVVAHYWNGNLVLQAPQCLEALLAYVCHHAPRALKGVIGPDAQALQAFAFLGLSTEDFALNSKENLYRLELPKLQVPKLLSHPPEGLNVCVRRFRADEEDLVTRWMAGYAREALNQPESPELWENSRRQAQAEIAVSSDWVLEVNGEPVASSRFNASLPEVVQVGGVWTLPEERGRGYARSVVAASLLEAREHGVSEGILFTAQDNWPAIRAYQSLGFAQIGHYRISLLKAERKL